MQYIVNLIRALSTMRSFRSHYIQVGYTIYNSPCANTVQINNGIGITATDGGSRHDRSDHDSRRSNG